MAGLNDIVASWEDFSNEVIREQWLPAMQNVAFRIDGSWFANKLRRTGDGVRGLKTKLAFRTKIPNGWRALNAHGGITPTGSPGAVDQQEIELGFHAASANVTLEQIKAFSTAREKAEGWADILNVKMQELYDTFPYYMKALIWTSSSANKALGVQNGSASGNEVTLDNDGLWHSGFAKDRVKLFEPGMWVQPYSSADVKLGDPVQITSADRTDGKITLSDASACEDDAYFTCSDIGGQDIPYTDKFPGLPDVLDDDNTFQGTDRSSSTNQWARAIVQSASGLTLNYDNVSGFLDDAWEPRDALWHRDMARAYFNSQLAEQRRFSSTDYEDGFNYIEIDGTRMWSTYDTDRDKIIVPDMENLWVAELGFENLFDQGWQPIGKQTMLEYVIVYIATMVAKDCRKMAVQTDWSY